MALFYYTTQRTIEIVADDEPTAALRLQAHLHDDETVLGVEKHEQEEGTDGGLSSFQY